MLSFVRALDISRRSRLILFWETFELNRAMLPTTSRRAYQTSRFRIVAKFAIASRYSRTVSVTMARRAPSL